MKRFTDFINVQEVAEPLAASERRFKAKHIGHLNDDPNAVEGNFVASTKKFINRGDYPPGMDKIVYESLEDVLPIAAINIAHKVMQPSEEEIRKKIIDEDTTVVPEGGTSDGDESHDNYKQKTAAITPARPMPKDRPGEPIMPEGGDSDGDESHDAYKRATAAQAPVNEGINLIELDAEGLRKFYKRHRKAKLTESEVKSGTLHLKDGTTIAISDEDAHLVDKLLGSLSKNNKKRLSEEANASASGFAKVMDFAKKAL